MYLHSQSRQLITAFTADKTCQNAYRIATLYISPIRGTWGLKVVSLPLLN